MAGVGHRCRRVYGMCVLIACQRSDADGLGRHFHVRVSEGCITEPVSERKERTIRHIQVLRYVLCFDRARMLRIGKLLWPPGRQLLIVKRLLANSTRKAHRQLPAW